MATRVPALFQPVDPRPDGLLLSDPRVAAQLVSYYLEYVFLCIDYHRIFDYFVYQMGCERIKHSPLLTGNQSPAMNEKQYSYLNKMELLASEKKSTCDKKKSKKVYRLDYS